MDMDYCVFSRLPNLCSLWLLGTGDALGEDSGLQINDNKITNCAGYIWRTVLEWYAVAVMVAKCHEISNIFSVQTVSSTDGLYIYGVFEYVIGGI